MDQTSTAVDAEAAAEPVGPYPHARREGEFLFLSGIGPRRRGEATIPGVTQDADGAVTAHDIEAQTHAVFANIEKVLAASGLGLEHVVDVLVFLTDMAGDFQRFNAVYAEYLGEARPTRTTIGVTALPTPIHVELKVVARVPPEQR